MSARLSQSSDRFSDRFADASGEFVVPNSIPRTPERLLLLGMFADAVAGADRESTTEREWFRRLDRSPDVFGTWPFVAGELGWNAAHITRKLQRRWARQARGERMAPIVRLVRLTGGRNAPTRAE